MYSSIADSKVEIQIQRAAGQIDFKMRDLYNRSNKLTYWLNRINTDLDGSDKTDLLYLVRQMQDKERSTL